MTTALQAARFASSVEDRAFQRLTDRIRTGAATFTGSNAYCYTTVNVLGLVVGYLLFVLSNSKASPPGFAPGLPPSQSGVPLLHYGDRKWDRDPDRCCPGYLCFDRASSLLFLLRVMSCPITVIVAARESHPALRLFRPALSCVS